MDCGQIYEEEVSRACIIEILLSSQKILDKILKSFLGSIGADMSFNVKYRKDWILIHTNRLSRPKSLTKFEFMLNS